MVICRFSAAVLLACFCALTSAGHSFVPKHIFPFQPITEEEYNAILDLSNGKPMIAEARLINSGLTAIRDIATNVRNGALIALNLTNLEPIFTSMFSDQKDESQGYPLCVVSTKPGSGRSQRRYDNYDDDDDDDYDGYGHGNSNPHYAYHPQPIYPQHHGYPIYQWHPVNQNAPHHPQGPVETHSDSGIEIQLPKGSTINGKPPVVNCVVVLKPAGTAEKPTIATSNPHPVTAHNPHYPVGPYPQHQHYPAHPQYASYPYYPQQPHQPKRTKSAQKLYRPHSDDDYPHRRPGNNRPSHRPDDDDDYPHRRPGNDRPSHRPDKDDYPHHRPGNNRPSHRPDDDDDYPHHRPGNNRPSHRPDDDDDYPHHRPGNDRPSHRPDNDRYPHHRPGNDRPSHRPDKNDYPHHRPDNDRHPDNYRPSHRPDNDRRPDHDRRPSGGHNQFDTHRPPSHQAHLPSTPLFSYPIIPILSPYPPYGSLPHGSNGNNPKPGSSSNKPKNDDDDEDDAGDEEGDEEGDENDDGKTTKLRRHYFGSGAKSSLYSPGDYKAPESINDVEGDAEAGDVEDTIENQEST